MLGIYTHFRLFSKYCYSKLCTTWYFIILVSNRANFSLRGLISLKYFLATGIGCRMIICFLYLRSMCQLPKSIKNQPGILLHYVFSKTKIFGESGMLHDVFTLSGSMILTWKNLIVINFWKYFMLKSSTSCL